MPLMEDEFVLAARRAVMFACPEAYRKVLNPEPKKATMLDVWVDGLCGREHRTYTIERSQANAYNSSVSGGQECWTREEKGPNGEPIIRRRNWIVCSGGGKMKLDAYVASFETYEEGVLFILYNLQADLIEVIRD